MSNEEGPTILRPSTMLTCSNVNLSYEMQLGELRQACACDPTNKKDLENNLKEIANSILHRWSKDGDWLSYGVILMHFGYETLNARLYKLALKYYDHARQIFSLRIAESQRQNEAAAHYGLGLVHLAMGASAKQTGGGSPSTSRYGSGSEQQVQKERIQAVDHFIQAQNLLLVARDYWQQRRNQRRVIQCEEAYHQLSDMIERIAMLLSGLAPTSDVEPRKPNTKPPKPPDKSGESHRNDREISGREWDMGISGPDWGSFRRGDEGIRFFEIPRKWIE